MSSDFFFYTNIARPRTTRVCMQNFAAVRSAVSESTPMVTLKY